MKRDTMGSALAALVVLGLAAAGLGCDGGAGVGAREEGLQLPSFSPIRPTPLTNEIGGEIDVRFPGACPAEPVERVEVSYLSIFGDWQTIEAELEPVDEGGAVVWSARVLPRAETPIVARPIMACAGVLDTATRSWTPERAGEMNRDVGFHFQARIEVVAEILFEGPERCLEGASVRASYDDPWGVGRTHDAPVRRRDGRFLAAFAMVAEHDSLVRLRLRHDASECNLRPGRARFRYGRYDAEHVELRPVRVRPDVRFTVDDEVLDWGACTTLRWELSNPFTRSPSVWLRGDDGTSENDLAPSGSLRLCPDAWESGGEIEYRLGVRDGAEVRTRRLDVRVRPREEPAEPDEPEGPRMSFAFAELQRCEFSDETVGTCAPESEVVTYPLRRFATHVYNLSEDPMEVRRVTALGGLLGSVWVPAQTSVRLPWGTTNLQGYWEARVEVDDARRAEWRRVVFHTE